jgi:selenide,water dikinase
MDSAIVKTKHNGIVHVSTTDFFYPLVNDPYLQGKIAAANVLSDMYAVGVSDCDFMLMLLAASTEMSADCRDICTKLMIKGFSDQAEAAGTVVTGGQTVKNPWPIIGGVATSAVLTTEYIGPEGALPGDVVVLTKPIGTQVAVNLREWMMDDNERWAKAKAVISEADALKAYLAAQDSMCRLNRTGARLMREYGAHSATDVTGFGLLGHAENLASHTTASVTIQIDVLPIIAGMRAVNDTVLDFKLLKGFSAETSGGLLVCLPADKAEAFAAAMLAEDGYPAWVVGKVVASDARGAVIADNVEVLEVS